MPRQVSIVTSASQWPGARNSEEGGRAKRTSTRSDARSVLDRCSTSAQQVVLGVEWVSPSPSPRGRCTISVCLCFHEAWPVGGEDVPRTRGTGRKGQD